MVGLIRIIFMGTPEFAVPSLERLLNSQHQVVAVYTQPDRPVGRGQQVVAPPVKRVAQAGGVPVMQPARLSDEGVKEQLASLSHDVIVVAAFAQLLPQWVLSLPRFGCLNIHPSLLPQHRGASPVAAAILAGDEVTGVTIMLMDAGLDTGPVLAQCQLRILDQDTTGSLTARLAQVGAQLLGETLPLWLRGEIKPQPQDESAANYTKMIGKGGGEIDWRLSALGLGRQVRAFQPWPSSYTWWQGKRLKVIKAVPLIKKGPTQPGRVVAVGSGEVGVETGDGVLELQWVQLEGKREMNAAEFVRGQREFIGAVLPVVNEL